MRKMITALGCVLMLAACESSEEDRREDLQEDISERYEDQMDRKQEALEETAEGQAEHDAILRGDDAIQEEMQGYRAEERIDDQFDRAEQQYEAGERHPGMPMPVPEASTDNQ